MKLNRIIAGVVVAAICGSACKTERSSAAVDGGADAGVDAGVDAGADAAVEPDGGLTEESVSTPPAEVLAAGTSGYLLRGVVLIPGGVLDPGEVLVEGAFITCVAADCSGEPGASSATIIDTHGVVSPGLIDSHNHLAYNFLPEWVPPGMFSNRYEVAADASFEQHLLPYVAHQSESSHFCPAAKWAELRSLIHGTTAIQGQPSAVGPCINWGIRNANRYHGLGYDHMAQRISSVRDINDADAQDLVDAFTDPTEPTTRYHVHMCEGVSGYHVEEEFESYAGRDPRANRHAGVNLLDHSTTILIHAMILTEAQLQEVLATDSMIVWSPSANEALYGATAPIERILQLGIVTGLGPDWTVVGEDEMLAEMRYAWSYGAQQGITEITPTRLWEMATWEGASVVGLHDHIGRLEVGYRADIAVFGRAAISPHRALIESRAADVRLVLIDGAGYFGDSNLEVATSRNLHCESLDACGTEKYICVQDSPAATDRRDETLDDIHLQLYNILEGVGYPAQEQYGRGDELLELVDCSL